MKKETAILAAILGASFIVRFLLFPLQGYQNDMSTFLSWFGTAADYGPRVFYSVVSWCDYPPFNVYLFWGFGSLAKSLSLFGTPVASYIVKLVPNIFDIATSILIFLFVRKHLSFKLSLAAAALYAFNPAVIFNAAVWGQFDAIYTFFLLLSLVLALKDKPELSAVSFAVGVLTKPQAIALLPLVVFLIFKKNGLKRLLFSVLAFTGTVFLVILPMEWSNPFTFLSNIYFGAYSGYAVTSANAFNLWGLFALWAPDGNLFILGWALFGAFATFVLFVLNKRVNESGTLLVLFSAFMLLFAFFMLPTRIHERYLFPAIGMLALMVPFMKKARLFYGIVTATLLTNLAYVLYWLNLGNPNLTGDPVVLAVGIANLVTFLYGALILWDELKGKPLHKTETVSTVKGERGQPR
jgi:Gpi18-like mannosyltransferase